MMARWAALCFLDFCGRVGAGVKQAAEKVTKAPKTIPRRLKPHSICSVYGTTKVVP
jgi:hypothetical protein